MLASSIGITLHASRSDLSLRKINLPNENKSNYPALDLVPCDLSIAPLECCDRQNRGNSYGPVRARHTDDDGQDHEYSSGARDAGYSRRTWRLHFPAFQWAHT